MANYINNKQLCQEMSKYREKYFEAKKSGSELPRIPNYIGLAIYQIANNLAKKGNFSGYTNNWKEEMISDGIENCMQYLHNFNPEKSKNPFAYFTRIIWFAFIRRIQKEKKQQYIKYKLSLNNVLDDNVYEIEHNELTHEKAAVLKEMFEPAKPAKEEEIEGIEKFIGEDNED